MSIFLWLLVCLLLGSNLGVFYGLAQEEIQLQTQQLVFVRFDGIYCQNCQGIFGGLWSQIAPSFPGAIGKSVDCKSQPQLCAPPYVEKGRLLPHEPTFCYYLETKEGEPLVAHWYTGQKHMHALEVWIEKTVKEHHSKAISTTGREGAKKESDGRQMHRNFDRIYTLNSWVEGAGKQQHTASQGGGSGSDLHDNAAYIAMLSNFMDVHKIRSIVEVGCGDFMIMSQVVEHLWKTATTYHGWDVSAVAIDRARKRHQEQHYADSSDDDDEDIDTVQFSVSGVDQQYEAADLLIVKDVLQHLPLRDCHSILSQLHKFKYAIIANDVAVAPTANQDIDMLGETMVAGGYRSLNVELPPFNLSCNETLQLHKKYQSVMPGGAVKTTCIIANNIAGTARNMDDDGPTKCQEERNKKETLSPAPPINLEQHKQREEGQKEASEQSSKVSRDAYLQQAYWKEYAELGWTYESLKPESRLRNNLGTRLLFLEETLEISKDKSIVVAA